ncbi:hypothetical protein [Pelagibius sp. 7325]|uniref:hypothetical protein n=1 Tax=Pelagibius sp. 7325 TaxID=3131994 RepID=UPI0030EF812D
MKIPKSMTEPLRQPLSWVIAVLGGLSLFNLCRNLDLVTASAPVTYLDQLYAAIRDLIFLPLETVSRVTWPAWLKNALVIYVVFARAYASSIAFLKEEMTSPPPRDPFFRNTFKAYPPFEKGPIHRKLVWVEAVLRWRWVQRLQPAVRKGLMIVVSFFWPVGIASLMINPTMIIETRGVDEVGAPHPADRSKTELPPLDEHGGYQYSPKFPAEGHMTQPIYDARLIFLAFILVQVLLALAMIVVNALLPGPEVQQAQKAMTVALLRTF